MARRLLLAATGAIALVAAGLGSATAQAAAPTAAAANAKITTHRVCAATPTRGHASCFALRRTDPAAAAFNAAMRQAAARGIRPDNGSTPGSGKTPTDLQVAYNLASVASASSSATVAIVDAYNDPTAESDLNVYRSQYGLGSCTTANGCFKKVNQSGRTTSLPATDAGWAQEISLDLDMVSAVCPKCKILLVEAKSASLLNLGTAVNTAAKLGATAISNSYGGGDLSDSSYGSYYNHPGIAVTASSGDSGYGASFPASSSYVTAVGGTSLTLSGTTRTETAWSGAGSGCSAYNAALSVASGFATGCSRRAEADVSAVADPKTGVNVYDTTVPTGDTSGWAVFGGTSASAPIIASVYALAHDVPTGTQANTLPYRHSSLLNDVIGGSNGTCPTTKWCNAVSGWDGPTGLGTPNGTGAF